VQLQTLRAHARASSDRSLTVPAGLGLQIPIEVYQCLPTPARAQSAQGNHQETAMRVLTELFTTDVGLMSAAGLVFMLGMGVFFVRYFLKHIQQDSESAARAK
jgi:hypothetical protein